MVRIVLGVWFVGSLPFMSLAQRHGADTTYQQVFRPQYHFSPRANWINDPNGLVYFDGEYHLFYQHNPFGTRWGHMTWGHAISRDLVHWRELPPALAEEGSTMIFSGSCVVDKTNSSGFGRGSTPPMVAIYTGHQENRQSQHIAYSTDKGRTWTKYNANPVIDLAKKDFRDPKVFWHEPTRRWVMVVLLPTEKKALFFNSINLRQWTKTGEFTSPDSPATIWECPDLVEVPVDNAVERKWVLLLSMGSNAPAGGSGMQYFVGRFDGKTFVSESKPGEPRYVDYGKDYYAAITYNNLPVRGNRGPISIGWMNNWQYANDLPTTVFRGAMTLPRELKLAGQTDGKSTRYHLRQRPVQELKQLLDTPFRMIGTDVAAFNRQLAYAEPLTDAYLLTAELETKAGDKDYRILLHKNPQNDDDATVIGYDMIKQQLYVDRSRVGQASFHKDFPGRYTAPLKPQNGRVSLQIWVDRSSVEVFANDGAVTMTNQVFPDPANTGIRLLGNGWQAVTIHPVAGIWR